MFKSAYKQKKAYIFKWSIFIQIFVVNNEYDFYYLISDLLQEILTSCFGIFMITSKI